MVLTWKSPELAMGRSEQAEHRFKELDAQLKKLTSTLIESGPVKKGAEAVATKLTNKKLGLHKVNGKVILVKKKVA